MIRFLFLSLLALAAAAPAAAMTLRETEVTCPITGKRFHATVQGSGTVFGVALDMRPFGAIEAPEPVPVCPDASRFPVWTTLSPTETVRVRQIVATPDYKRLIAEEHQTYYVIAQVKRQLGEDPVDVARDLLQASWQAAAGSAQQRRYLTEARAAFAGVAPGQTSQEGLTSRYFEAELSRQLGDFAGALALLDRWFPNEGAGQDAVGTAFLAQERAAVQRREAGPVPAVPPDGAK